MVWTTRAWLIWDHLSSADRAGVKRLERAIEPDLIVWHGLPFTTHTELMAPALFRAGPSYTQERDQHFARHTIAATMTDVPGHTLGLLPDDRAFTPSWSAGLREGKKVFQYMEDGLADNGDCWSPEIFP